MFRMRNEPSAVALSGFARRRGLVALRRANRETLAELRSWRFWLVVLPGWLLPYLVAGLIGYVVGFSECAVYLSGEIDRLFVCEHRGS